MKSQDSFDSVIIPVRKTIEEIKKSKVYKQQLERRFKIPVSYLVFYVDKRVVGYGRISKIEELITHREYFIEKFIEVDLPHLEKGFFIIGRKYTSFEKLLNAKTTKDL